MNNPQIVRRPSPVRNNTPAHQPTVKVLTPKIQQMPGNVETTQYRELRPASKYEITQMYGARGYYSGKGELIKPGDPRYDASKPPDQQRRNDMMFTGVGCKRTTTDPWVAAFFCAMMTYRTEKGEGRTIITHKDQVYKFYVTELS
jgi:hypothetical protein